MYHIKQSNELPAHNIYSDINLYILELNKKANIKKLKNYENVRYKLEEFSTFDIIIWMVIVDFSHKVLFQFVVNIFFIPT